MEGKSCAIISGLSIHFEWGYDEEDEDFRPALAFAKELGCQVIEVD